MAKNNSTTSQNLVKLNAQLTSQRRELAYQKRMLAEAQAAIVRVEAEIARLEALLAPPSQLGVGGGGEPDDAGVAISAIPVKLSTSNAKLTLREHHLITELIEVHGVRSEASIY